MSRKIAIIGVYFGQLPNYFPLWLHSCEKNPEIDFLLFTDNDVKQLPLNVKCYLFSLDRVQTLASEILGFRAYLDKPYKICDYKILYGLIFREYIKEYDYWGHCDFDLIFGDLQAFFQKFELEKYDKFLTLGHLSLYKNVKEVNERYRCDGAPVDYKTIYTSQKNYAFDEINGVGQIYQKNKYPIFTRRIFADIATVYHRYRVTDAYPLDTKPKNYKKQIFYWEKGKTYRAFVYDGKIHREEYIYIHFQKRPNYSFAEGVQKADSFYITNKGFYAKTGDVTVADINLLNPYPGAIYELGEKVQWKLNKFLKRVLRKLRFSKERE